MTYLPVVQRELRVSSRSRATRLWRLLAALGAIVIAGAVGLISLQSRGLIASQSGVWIFDALKWLAFITACLSGVFLTSDSLSQEKREGTLGLLFLTDLRGYDVAFGKLLATSLRTVYSLFAIFPVMALAFVLGGVTGGEFWHSVVALLNALFFSLALGVAVSAFSRDATRAMSATLAILVVFVLVLPQFSATIMGRYLSWPRLLSPTFAFTQTTAYRTGDFWLSLLFVHALGWSLLILASWLVPKTWQEKGLRKSSRASDRFSGLFGGAASGQLLDQNPVAWIIARDRWAANIARLAVILILGLMLLSVVLSRNSSAPRPIATMAPVAVTSSSTVTSNSSTSTTSFVVSASAVSGSIAFQIASGLSGLLSFGLELWLAAQVSRFYVEGRKSGFLELLLVTPIAPPDIIRGHWLALRRLFLMPMVAQLALSIMVGVFSIIVTTAAMASVSGPGAITASSMTNMQVAMLILGSISWTIGLFAIAWFSIYMGVNTKTLPIAVLKTFLFVKILPWMGVGFASAILAFAVIRSGLSTIWLITSIPQALIILANLGLIAFARVELRTAFSSISNPR